MIPAMLFLLLNFIISWANAWYAGQVWTDAKVAGGWSRCIAWSAAIMSACGFTWVFMFFLALAAKASGVLHDEQIKILIELTYVAAIIPILGSGLAIWAGSLADAWRDTNLISVGSAAWNTYAMAHNVSEAASLLPTFVEDIGDFFGGAGDDDSPGHGLLVVLVIFLFLVAVVGGALLTTAILKSSAKDRAIDIREGAV